MITNCALALVAWVSIEPTDHVGKTRRGPDGTRVYHQSKDYVDIESAKALARDLGGYLVSIESEEEERWIREKFGVDEAQWIGLEGDCATWASGARVQYENWIEVPRQEASGEQFAVRSLCPTGVPKENCKRRPGGWSTVEGDVVYRRYKALIEVELSAAEKGEPGVDDSDEADESDEGRAQDGLEGGAGEVARASLRRGVLLLAIEGFSQEELADPRWSHVQVLRDRSAFSSEVHGDPSGSVLANWALLLGGTGSWKNGFDGDSRSNWKRYYYRCLAGYVSYSGGRIGSASILEDSELSGHLTAGERIQPRFALKLDAGESKSRRARALDDVLSSPLPMFVQVGWSEPQGSSAKERSVRLERIQAEIGEILARIEARPERSVEEWLVVLAGICPPEVEGGARKKRTAQGDGTGEARHLLLLSGPGIERGPVRSSIGLGDVVPTCADFLDLRGRYGWCSDGLSLLHAPAAALGEELVRNGSFESQAAWHFIDSKVLVAGWECSGSWKVIPYASIPDLVRSGEARSGDPGLKLLAIATSGPKTLEQNIDLRALTLPIRTGKARFRLEAWLGGSGVSRSLDVQVEFQDERGKSLRTSTLDPVSARDRSIVSDRDGSERKRAMLLRSIEERVPSGAVRARILVDGTHAQTLMDSYVDGISLKIRLPER